MSDFIPLLVGDRVEVLVHSRAKGVAVHRGGWSYYWIVGTVMKVNRKTATICTDVNYFGHFVNLPFCRIRLLESQRS